LDSSRTNAHRIGLSVINLAPDQSMVRALSHQTNLPYRIDDVHLDAFALFSARLDRQFGKTGPILTAIEITEFRLLWGSLRLFADGSLVNGPQGQLEADIALRIEGWQQLPAVLAVLGLLKPQDTRTIERTIQILADQGADPKVLEVPFKMNGGQMWLGPIQLGAVPRLN